MARQSLRDQIVQAAFATFYEKGFNGSSVQDITAAAGVPKGSFYNHFDSKEALAAEIIDRYDVSNVLLTTLSDRAVPALKRLDGYFRGLSQWVLAQEGAKGCMLGNFSAEMADHSLVVRARLNAVYSKWTRAIEGAIRDGQKEKTIPKDLDPEILAGTLLDAFEGAILRTRVEKTGRPLEQFMTVAFDKILS